MSEFVNNHTDLIFENYDVYLNQHRNELNTPAGAIEMLSSDGSFRSYMAALTEGLDVHQKSAVMAVCERQRQFLLEESTQLGPSASVIGYAVTYFPILADIYADPVVSRVATIYPTTKPINTIPKVQLTATVRNTDGTSKTFLLPRAQYLVRGAAENITLLPNTNNDLFKMSHGYPNEVNSTLARINKRYFMINTMSVIGKDVGSGVGDTTSLIGLNLRPDARGQIHKEFEMTDSAGFTVNGSIIGHVDWDKGVVQFSTTFTSIEGMEYETEFMNSKVIFSPKTGEVGRVKVDLKISGWDVNIDTKEDFEIELQAETIQDYKDIYNIDLVRTMSEAIKTQILLNKDWDLSYFLESAETEMNDNGTYQSINMGTYFDRAGVMSPRNLIDIMKSVTPRITMNNTVIFRNFRAEPQYLLTGLRTGALLKTMQTWATNMPNMSQGEVGYVSESASFAKQTVLMSPAISDEKIYQVYKAPNDNLSRSVIIDFIYKPIYIIEEITNSMKRTFVKSRTALELCATHALGCVNVTGLNNILGTDYRSAPNVLGEKL